jgi:uncharacterized small protein (DUF1192 family)
LGVRELFPLQIGDINTIVILVVGIAFAIVVVVLVVNALRRSSAMSDELSTAWEKKFEAIKPAAMTEKETQTTPRPQSYPQAGDRSRDTAAYSALQTELRENQGRLQRNLQEIDALKEDETRIRNDILDLKTQIGSLQERFSASQEEIRRLKTQIEASAKQQPPTAPAPEPMIQPAPEPPPLEEPTSETWITRHLGDVFNRSVCPNCGRHIQSSDIYCDSCGQQLPRTI